MHRKLFVSDQSSFLRTKKEELTWYWNLPGREHKGHYFLCGHSNLRGGAVEYEGDGYMPNGERKQGAYGVGFCQKKGSHWEWDPKHMGLFWCERPKI